MLSKKKANDSYLNKVIIDGEEIFNQQKISDSFNRYFCGVGKEINDSIPPSTRNFKDYIKKKIDEVFFMSPIYDSDIARELNKLNSKKASGPDICSPKLLKLCGPSIIKPLLTLFNKSIADACYPSEWKLAKIIAIYKKKSRFIPENYRPISLLNCIGKIFERLIFNQMIIFIDKHKIIYLRQFGFRKGYSTILALIDTVDKI